MKYTVPKIQKKQEQDFEGISKSNKEKPKVDQLRKQIVSCPAGP